MTVHRITRPLVLSLLILVASHAGNGCGSSTRPDGGGGGDGGADCGCGQFAPYRICCGGRCVNHKNDPANCNGCGVQCPSATPFCDNGACTAAPCESGTTCASGSCCGTSCCAAGQICCGVEGPISVELVCNTPSADTPSCPTGCAPLCISDRNLKRAITPVDTQSVLEAVRRLPLSTWRYRDEPGSVRHLGPMAQDFRAAFGLGDDDRTLPRCGRARRVAGGDPGAVAPAGGRRATHQRIATREPHARTATPGAGVASGASVRPSAVNRCRHPGSADARQLLAERQVDDARRRRSRVRSDDRRRGAGRRRAPMSAAPRAERVSRAAPRAPRSASLGATNATSRPSLAT